MFLLENKRYPEEGNFLMGRFKYLSNGYITLYKLNSLRNILSGWFFKQFHP